MITISVALVLIGVLYASFKWAKSIDEMNENYPDYKGDDFLDWDNKKKR